MAKFRVSYNAPVVLTFALLAVAIHIAGKDITRTWFTTHVDLDGFAAWFALIGHILGHGDWDHLISNFMLILLLGPILEERYGSIPLLIMILLTGLLSGVIDVAIDQPSLGASGIVFMMILLASTANIRQGEIPLTFIAVSVIYLGAEVMKAFEKDNISQLAHILGGLSGAAFGFLHAKAKAPDAPKTAGLPMSPKPKPRV